MKKQPRPVVNEPSMETSTSRDEIRELLEESEEAVDAFFEMLEAAESPITYSSPRGRQISPPFPED
jgi:hypothetical protein